MVWPARHCPKPARCPFASLTLCLPAGNRNQIAAMADSFEWRDATHLLGPDGATQSAAASLSDAVKWRWDEQNQVVRGVEPLTDEPGAWITVVASRWVAGSPDEVAGLLTEVSSRPDWDETMHRAQLGPALGAKIHMLVFDFHNTELVALRHRVRLPPGPDAAGGWLVLHEAFDDTAASAVPTEGAVLGKPRCHVSGDGFLIEPAHSRGEGAAPLPHASVEGCMVTYVVRMRFDAEFAAGVGFGGPPHGEGALDAAEMGLAVEAIHDSLCENRPQVLRRADAVMQRRLGLRREVRVFGSSGS